MSKFLVTGGAGFIGSNLVEALLMKNHEVTVLDNLSTGKLSNIHPFLSDIRFIKGDIQNLATCKRAVRGVDYILHQAAMGSVQQSMIDPVQTHQNNVNGTVNLLTAARDANVEKVVLATSCAAYGNSDQLPLTEDVPASPVSPYATSKLVTELYASIFHRAYDLQAVCLRYFNVFGPKQDPLSQYAAVIPKFMLQLLQNESPEIHGDGEQTRDFTYIDNVIQANLRACDASVHASGKVFNIACQQQVSLNQLYDLLCTKLGKSIMPTYIEARSGDVKHSLADISQARMYLNYEPEVDFAQGMEKALDWYIQSSEWPAAATESRIMHSV
ncbi:SDR family oxidoreductase [Paenibacillus sp. N1-5-1-14]|uniref:SDR family oxidoreductase n=1 Tax=Paenibacillus radicibacter TaxID=2972488 RepID=UPI00215961C2|nr:SDR family oxidoreductase [Paenibacillus radicibacter]MCR8641075.1 SDR family oxidoreductase [Paenibacillus radicibacter]